MADYFQVSPTFWTTARAQDWNDNEKQLGAYLLTCKHRNLEGLYHLPKAYMADDLDWNAKKLGDALAALIGYGFCQYDEDAQVVFLVDALKQYAPTSETQIKGALRVLDTLPPTPLYTSLYRAAEQYAPGFSEAMDDPVETTRTKPRTTSTPSSSSSNGFSSDAPDSDDGDEGMRKYDTLVRLFLDRGYFREDILEGLRRYDLRRQGFGEPVNDVERWLTKVLGSMSSVRSADPGESRRIELPDGTPMEFRDNQWVEIVEAS